MRRDPLTYADAGVDIGEADVALERMRPLLESTYGPGVVSKTGTFAALFVPEQFPDQVLTATIDGVGTKAKVAPHHTVGGDIVRHCGNDTICQGASPLFFLDYVGSGTLSVEMAEGLTRGMADTCREIGCLTIPIIGGETAQMPDTYQGDAYDLVGCMIGMVGRSCLITGEGIQPGNVVIGFPSVGIHTNGYSLARKVIFEIEGLSVGSEIPGLGISVGEELSKPHRSYLKAIQMLQGKVVIRGIAHITGGGLPDNIRRILPEACRAVIRRETWDALPIFAHIQKAGGVEDREMFRVFNMGIGMVLAIEREDQDQALELLQIHNETPIVIGEIVQGERGVEIV
ncbi:phosphoribosylformylglycinamidine cyclo-ligase [bacterium]|nr:phosphoribosylformylglycinamidine cyclo-ligase [bacterium]|tara:strand:+ start:13836 stop:14864 length:1029 start_codon:yes stop_codon:yes gene_type:complete